MGTRTVYLSKEIEKKVDEEVEKRNKKGEMINGKPVGDSHIMQEALKARYKIKQ